MVMEMFRDGHNLPKFTPKTQRTGPRRFTTTVQSVYAKKGSYTFDDHATPWSVVATQLEFNLVRQANLQAYVGTAGFETGTVQIQNFKPMSAKMQTRLQIDGPKVQLPHIDLITDGAESHVSGWVDFSKQEHFYNVSSRVDFPRMRELFFANETWRLAGEGEFEGTFHLYRGGRELLGQFTSEEAVVNDLRFQDLHGSLVWDPKRFAVTHADSRFYGGEINFAYALEPLGSARGSTATFSGDFTDVDVHDFTRYFNWSCHRARRARRPASSRWPGRTDGFEPVSPAKGK